MMLSLLLSSLSLFLFYNLLLLLLASVFAAEDGGGGDDDAVITCTFYVCYVADCNFVFCTCDRLGITRLLVCIVSDS